MPKEIVIRGEIGWDSQATPEYLEAQLADAAGVPITVKINSPGGFVFDGLDMANQLRHYTGEVTMQITGLAASMASYIAVSAGRLEVEDNAVFMIHNPLMLAIGDHRVMEEASQILKSLAATLSRAYAAKSGKTPEEIQTLMNKTTWLFGEEIEVEGFADQTLVAGDGAENRETAVQTALVAVAACADAMKKQDKPQDEGKIAALLTGAVAPVPEIKQKVVDMTLAELLEANPNAKAEIDALVEAAAAPGQAVKAAFEVARAALDSDAYPQAVKTTILDMALEGNGDGAKAAISMFDKLGEAKASDDARKNGAEETPPEDPEKAPTGVMATNDDVNAKIEQLNRSTQPGA